MHYSEFDSDENQSKNQTFNNYKLKKDTKNKSIKVNERRESDDKT